MLYASVILSGLVLAWVVYSKDIYDKEPKSLLGLTLLLGMATGYGVGFLEDLLIKRWSLHEDLFGQSVLAGTLEEGCKFLVVLLVAVCFRRHFNDPIDGLIYGAFAGLGAALEESVFYLNIANSSTHWSQPAGAEVVRLLLHLMLGGLGGLGVGVARFPRRLPAWPLLLFTGLGLAMTIHFAWNNWCGLPRKDHDPAVRRIVAIGLMSLTTLLFGISVFVASRWSREVINPGSHKHLWGWPFTLLLPQNPEPPDQETFG